MRPSWQVRSGDVWYIRTRFMKKLQKFGFWLVLATLYSTAYPYVGKWRSYTNLSPVTVLMEYQGQVYAGTPGGIRRINPVDLTEKTYDNLDGLLDVNIEGLAVTEDGQLWAASRDGYLARLEGERWRTYGRSYAAANWKISRQAFLAAGRYLVLGSDKGLSFFDIENLRAEVNVDRFGALGQGPVHSLLRKGDTLFVGKENGVVKAAVDFSAILSDRFTSVFDPGIWTETQVVSIPVVSPVPVDTLDPDTGDGGGEVVADTLKPLYRHLYFEQGKLHAGDLGATLQAPVYVRAVRGLPLVVGDTALSEFDVFSSAAIAGNRLFLGVPWGVFVLNEWSKVERTNLFGLKNPSEFPSDTLGGVAVNGSRVMAVGKWGLYSLEGKDWVRQQESFIQFPFIDMFARNLKSLAQDRDGNTFVGSWGFGLGQFNGGTEEKYWHSTNSCLEGVPGVEEGRYTVISSVSNIRGENLWMVNMQAELSESHSLVNLNIKTGNINCFSGLGVDGHVRAIRILSDTLFAEATRDNGVFVYSFDPDYPATAPNLIKKVSAPEGANSAWDVSADRFQRLWFLMDDRLAYIDDLTTLSSSTELDIKNDETFGGRDCKIMEPDALGNFWIGCANGLFHFKPSDKGSKPISRRYTQDDGLLDNAIRTLAVNQSNGEVWIGTDKGISVFHSPGRAPEADLKRTKVYPNPFRPQHSQVIFDQLAAGSTLQILTQAGYVVRHFSASEILGNQFQWDGTNQSGKRVTPGIYLYNIEANGKVSRGKLIIAR